MRQDLRTLASIIRSERSIRRVVAAGLARSGVSSRIKIKRGGYRLIFHPTAYSKELWVDPCRGLAEEAFIAGLLRQGDIAVDVGANIGTVTLAMAGAVGATGRVISIEAHPRTYRFLVENIHLNQANNVCPLNIAVGSEQGLVRFSDIASDDQNFVESGEGAATVAAKMERLDSVLVCHERIALLKIDVEGYEQAALVGLGDLLAGIGLIQFEYFAPNYRRYGFSFAEVHGILVNAGFDVVQQRDHDFQPLTAEFQSSECINLMAVNRRLYEHVGLTPNL